MCLLFYVNLTKEMGSQRPSAMAHASAGSNNAPKKLNPLSSLLVILLLAYLKEEEEYTEEIEVEVEEGGQEEEEEEEEEEEQGLELDTNEQGGDE